MTSKGLVVTEIQEDIAGLPSASAPAPAPIVASPSVISNKSVEPPRKSPIAELLYMRWLEGLKIKWPSLT